MSRTEATLWQIETDEGFAMGDLMAELGAPVAAGLRLREAWRCATEGPAMTILVPALVGIASALLTIILTPTLQHYFWRLQRHAERQLTIIEWLNKWAAEVEYYFMTTQLSLESQDNLFKTLTMLSGNVRILFSSRAAERCQTLYDVIMDLSDSPPLSRLRLT